MSPRPLPPAGVAAPFQVVAPVIRSTLYVFQAFRLYGRSYVTTRVVGSDDGAKAWPSCHTSRVDLPGETTPACVVYPLTGRDGMLASPPIEAET
jgi:hypothetical protein